MNKILHHKRQEFYRRIR